MASDCRQSIQRLSKTILRPKVKRISASSWVCSTSSDLSCQSRGCRNPPAADQPDEEKCHFHMQEAKKALLNAVTLQHPSPTAQVQLNTDASATHVSAALLQREDEQQQWAPMAFYSKCLNTAQRKYFRRTRIHTQNRPQESHPQPATGEDE